MVEKCDPKLSVIVCFKDWGLERLKGVTQSIQQSELGGDLEIIISDYGSEDSEGYAESLEALGARYFYFETDGVWSRSRALNLGIKEARGEYIVTTDSDMVFTPSTFPALLNLLEDNQDSSFILQCRDLPEGIDHEYLLSESVNWEEVDALSKLRPRWGMGGLIAFHRSAYVEIRGLDERFEIYGGEDLDLAKRLVRAGYKRNWILDPQIKMYHVWHPSSRQMADETPEGRAAIARNTNIHKSDISVIRNLEHWGGRPSSSDPLVTVAISTFNRADFILESVRSVQSQTFQDWELVIVNDGSTDETESVLATIDDPRVRVFNRNNVGLAAARNFITSVAKGKYIAVHDDDDLMLPTRLADELAAIKPGTNGSTGAWVNFNNETGALDYQTGKAYSVESILFNSGVYLHPTLLVERSVLQAIPYNETMRSGSDFNLAVRMARGGVKLNHSGKIVMLRRMHDAQITNSHGDLQKVSGRVSSNMGRALMLGYDKRVVRESRASEDAVSIDRPANLWDSLGPYLPDHLVPYRTAKLQVSLLELTGEQQRLLASIPKDFEATLKTQTGTTGLFEFSALSLMNLTTLFREFGSTVEVSELMVPIEDTPVDPKSRLDGLAGLASHESIWKKSQEFLSSGVYAVIQTSDASNELNSPIHGYALTVSIHLSDGAFTWEFYAVPEARVLEDITVAQMEMYNGAAGSLKLAYLQKD